MPEKGIIAIIGAGSCDENISRIAERMGKLIAEAGFVLVCGGLGGVMEAAAKGAKKAGGLTIGILPGFDKQDANPHIDIPIITGLSHARNVIVVRSSDIVVAITGEYGTLSEIALALKMEKVVIGIDTWDIEGVIKVKTPEEAMEKIKELL
ncbi:MAG: TIGR00725 family protein [Deltaproteobacteria bacterium GWC2_42_11]|nr:MAG: TIGR00725 family protein [Deltaproteobacteria bacterium GWC2_42_11]HBO84312.1 TIGR00725 family protein [Deltaproteobacteria bacterium]